MKGMTPDETAGYIRHHLEQAGRTAELFTDEAVAQIHQACTASELDTWLLTCGLAGWVG